jgi:hypothetical protein
MEVGSEIGSISTATSECIVKTKRSMKRVAWGKKGTANGCRCLGLIELILKGSLP